MSITKEQVLKDLDKVKEYVQEIENKKEEKKVGIEIKNRFTGSIVFSSTKTTFKEAVEEAKNSGANLCNADLSDANLSGADLRNANLCGADLCNAELQNARFYGRGGSEVIKKANLEGFLGALGFKLEE